MTRTDYRKKQPTLYRASPKTPSLVRVPAMQFVMIDGEGDPNGSPQFQESIEALYAVSYTREGGLRGHAARGSLVGHRQVPVLAGRQEALEMDVDDPAA